MKTVEVRHPLVQHKIGLLRDAGLSTKGFRELVTELGTLLAYEATADLETEAATMSGWALRAAEACQPLVELLHEQIRSGPIINLDETTVQVLKEPNREAKKKSRMWLFCSARCNVPVYVFEYHETRRKGVAQEFLAGWSGTLTANGYKPYFNLGNPNIANTACLVHVRR